MANGRTTTARLLEMKAEHERITALTAWDHWSGAIADEAGVDFVLVGDSLSMTIRGDENTLKITLDDMIYHSRMVATACRRAMIITDMPFMSYQVSEEQALVNAGRCVQEAGVQGVKIEGGAKMVRTVERLTGAGIPVVGHIGLTPQSVLQLGGFKAQGKTLEPARALIRDARELADAGICALVIECVPALLAKRITAQSPVPTIGIGAGEYCDGQIQVTADLLGMSDKTVPKHAKAYGDLRASASAALAEYVADVRAGRFPQAENSIAAPDGLESALESDDPETSSA